MRKCILALATLFSLTSAGYAAFAIFQTALISPTADWVRDITASPYSATCDGVADDKSAFDAFNVDAAAQSALGNSVMLVIPSGKTCMYKSGTIFLGRGSKWFTIYAYGASLSNGGTGTLLFGGEGQKQVGNNASVRLATATAGDSCVNFLYPTPSPAVTVSNIVSTGSTWRLTVSDTSAFFTGQILRVSDVVGSFLGTLNGLQFMTVVSPGVLEVQNPSNFQASFSYGSGGKINDYTGLFSVDQWVLLGGSDVQAIYRSGGYGSPSNPAVYEYLKISSVDLVSGQICFTTPLVNSYKSTWPNYDVGGNFGPDPGGGATLWSLDSSWDSEYRIYGLTLNSPSGQQRMLSRSFYVQDLTDTSSPSSFPSQTGSFTGVNSSWASNFEIDKINGPFTCTGCAFNIIHTQSRSSATTFTLNNSTANQINGTAANTVFSGVTANTQIQLGPAGYGTSTSFVGTNLVTPSLQYVSVGATALSTTSGYSIAGDTISIVQSTITSYPAWAVEGSYVCWYGTSTECEDVAKIIDIGESGGSTTIRLNKSYAGSTWPATSGGVVNIRAHPMPAITCATCSGTDELTGMAAAPAGAPLYSYYSQAYSGTIGTALQERHKLWGKLLSLSMNVTNAGTGVAFRLSGFNNWPMISPAFTSVSGGWNSAGSGPAVNTGIVGDRTITLSGTYAIAGTKSGDAGWTTPDSAFMWFPARSNSGSAYASAPTGCPGASCPSVTVTIQTDQGVVP